MGACCSRRSNKIAAERQALKEAVSSEVHGLMDQHHRLIATTEQGSIVRLSNGQQVPFPYAIPLLRPPSPPLTVVAPAAPSQSHGAHPGFSPAPLAAASRPCTPLPQSRLRDRPHPLFLHKIAERGTAAATPTRCSPQRRCIVTHAADSQRQRSLRGCPQLLLRVGWGGAGLCSLFTGASTACYCSAASL